MVVHFQRVRTDKIHTGSFIWTGEVIFRNICMYINAFNNRKKMRL